ncbi:ABC transporter permease [Symbioplanes lichenis]|uniref:ABC transporter permease n=1 Tax=Symbioplanes lichenis TaxID=1629072 RepID=UPI002739B8F5|nr:ABC transporter permease [Actinoplanes lichenis]
MTGSAHLRTVHVLWRRELLRFARSPLRVAMVLLLPLLFLVVLGTGLDAALAPGAGGEFRAYLFPGAVLMAVQAPALSVGASIVWDRRSGFLRQVLVAPVARRAVLLGICLGGATTGGRTAH